MLEQAAVSASTPGWVAGVEALVLHVKQVGWLLVVEGGGIHCGSEHGVKR